MRTPDHTGQLGEAWKFQQPTQAVIAAHPAWGCSLASWLIHVPTAHPAWSWYLLTVISLRDIPGMPPAYKQFTGADHEVLIYALDPAHPLPDPDDGDAKVPAKYLSPPNLVHQVGGATDEMMIDVIDLLAHAFVDGYANPDSDYRRHTANMINSAIECVVMDGITSSMAKVVDP